METKNIILKLRTERGMSQDELADKIMVTRQAVSRWENGDTVPNTDSAVGIDEVCICISRIVRSLQIAIAKRCLENREGRNSLAITLELALAFLICL